jgi:hypothetical protein
MTGAFGIGSAVTTIGVEGSDVHPFPSMICTVYEPPAVIVMLGVVSDVDHKFPVLADEFRTIDDPAQNEAVVPFVIEGVGGNGFTDIVLGADIPDEHPFNIT